MKIASFILLLVGLALTASAQTPVPARFDRATGQFVEPDPIGIDAGSTDTYTATLSPAITAYQTGGRYLFRANTANTGAATINLNGIGAKTIVKVSGGTSPAWTTLSDGDILAGQWVETIYDGTVMQIQGTLGNSSAGVGVTDGDKGDITVSGAGAVWTIDSATIALSKMANLAQNKIIGRFTASTGVPEAITVGTDFTLAGGTMALANAYQLSDPDLDYLAGFTPSANVKTILNAADYSAIRTSLGLVIGTNVQAYDATLTGMATTPTTLSATTALVANTWYKGAISTRTVTISAASSFPHARIHYTGTAAASTVITWPVSTIRQVGSSGYATTTTFAIGNAEFDLYSDGTDWYLADSTGAGGSSIADGDKGDITTSGSGATWTVDSAAISLAKMANLAQSRLIGRATASTGVPEAITVGSDFTLAGGTIALANAYQASDARLTALTTSGTTLSATTALVANTFYIGAISTRTVTLSAAASFPHAHIHYAGTAAASTVITWPASTVRQVGSSGYATSTTFAIGNAEFDLLSDGTDWLSSDSTGTSGGGGSGTVTSVGFTGGLISVATATTTPALTVAGTSGGIPYFSSSSTWASSAALAANAIVLGGGAGTTPATTATGTGVVTALGVNTGSAGAFVVNGGALGTPSSGTGTNITGIPEGGLSTTDITTNNATTSKHGFLKKLSNSAGEYMDGSGNWSTPAGTGGTSLHALTFTVDGAGSAVTTGVKMPIKTPYSGTLTGYTMVCSPSGSITFNIFRAADGAGLPTASIINSAGGGGGSGTLPAIASGVEGKSTTFTSWGSTSITAFDNLALNLTTVDSVVTKCTLVLYYQ